jgi:hypothetical protein
LKIQVRVYKEDETFSILSLKKTDKLRDLASMIECEQPFRMRAYDP